MEWISVEDRLPTTMETVDVKCSNGAEAENFMFHWGEWGFDEYSDITHWKPQPPMDERE